jgi:RNA polymerase-binding transcription factor
MDGSEIRKFQRILEHRHAEAIRSLDRLGRATRNANSDYPKDTGDLCEATLSREALFQQTSEERLTARLIEIALARIQQGTFGVCIACGDEINLRRLDALPWAEYCLRCKQCFEQGDTLEHRSRFEDGRVPLKRAG